MESCGHHEIGRYESATSLSHPCNRDTSLIRTLSLCPLLGVIIKSFAGSNRLYIL